MDYKQKTIITLKKAKSLNSKVIEMLESDKYCIDIIQQNLAIIGLLKSANLSLLEGHLGCCVTDAAIAKDKKRLGEMMNEILKVVKTAQNK
ncbi:MAG: metal-sensing transcriptional repressor [Patescibacteria group bacterium]